MALVQSVAEIFVPRASLSSRNLGPAGSRRIVGSRRAILVSGLTLPDLKDKVSSMAQSQINDPLALLTGELNNFQEIAAYIVPQPGEIPRIEGIDVYGDTVPLNGVVGGDHVIYVDFKKRYDLQARITQAEAAGRPEVVANLERCRNKAGIVLLDVSGHHATDALLAAMLHQAFLLGSLYELDMFGHITRRLFENLNSRFYQSSSLHKFVTMIYGEIGQDATFRFLSAAHPPP